VTPPPLIVLGVRRSGTTLLRVILDRSPGIAIPDETYFFPQLAARHRGSVDSVAFLDDVRRLPRVRELGVDPQDVAPRLREGMTAGEAIGAVMATYADTCGKERWGDKTPLYMRHVPQLERLFPDAQYVHLVRDGRDAALSFLAVPGGLMTEGWGHPRDAVGFARMWRTEVEDARSLGRRTGEERFLEVRYEALVADPYGTVRDVCAFAGLPFDPAMLAYAENVDVSSRPHQQRLRQPPTAGVRDWRAEMSPADVEAFEAIAGDLLAGLGYDVSSGGPPSLSARSGLAAYRAQVRAWNVMGQVVQRSPLWKRRHPRR
jgi:Sulfotransferase family